MEKMQITCQDLSFTIESKKIIDSFNYTFENSKLYAIKGLNGSGKSTLLKIITGLALDYQGKLQLNHKNYTDLSAQELSLLVSFVSTRHSFTFPMQVAELLEHGRYLQQNMFGQISAQDLSIIQEVISSFQIESLYHKNVQTLSDGELQQVMIALAVIRQTPFIVLDEPTSFLDYLNREKIWNLLVSLKNAEKGIIIATHDLDEMKKHADEIIELTQC